MLSSQKQQFKTGKEIKMLNCSSVVPPFCVGHMIKGNYTKY